MNVVRKMTLLVAIISLLFCFSTINETYAKYNTSLEGKTNMSVARWHILVNNQDVRNNSSTSAELAPTFLGTEHIAPDVIAPTSEGYVDLIIDSSQVDVSFSYTITPDVDATSSVTDLIVTGYTVNSGEKIAISNGQSITDNIYKIDNVNLTTIRLYVKWDDSSNSKMTNEEDTNASFMKEQAKLKLNIKFIQIPN